MKSSPFQLCINTGLGFDEPVTEKLYIIKFIGFDGFFNDKEKLSDHRQTEQIANTAAKLGLIYQSLHAPFYGMGHLWHDPDSEEAANMERDLLASIDDCSRFGIPLVIMHAIIGMERCTPNETGLSRLAKIIDHAVKKNVVIGFENTEGEVYLEQIFSRFGAVPNVRFTFDSGHEMCYNYSRDLLAKYGKYLVSTHLNDNLGMTDPNHMTFYDDSHLLPFDGIRDWQETARRLRRCGYRGALTFEVNSKNKPERHANDLYREMDLRAFLSAAYAHAVRFRALMTQQEERCGEQP